MTEKAGNRLLKPAGLQPGIANIKTTVAFWSEAKQIDQQHQIAPEAVYTGSASFKSFYL